MSRRYITTSEQQEVVNRANRRCEYCQCPMDYSSQSFVLEHIIPVAINLNRSGVKNIRRLLVMADLHPPS
jgi:hypothetical protein